MSVTKALLLVAQLPALASSASINPYHIDYGYWNANVSVNNVRMTNTEFYSRVCIVSAEYWAYPGVINQWGTLHSNVISTIGFGQPASFDDTSFGANDVDGQGDQPLIMWQTVTLNGVEYDIEGEAMVAMSCGEAPERLCTGSARVDAALRVPNGPAAPHIPATIISLGFSQETNTATPA
ncbi:hypothetical protein F5B22DRAFT_107480 [Xylaria bambusicola]|uniref:uncharacterized protein n=1 Tax=Xylaria bambusicola TaxID=326684 RepID=UPI0020078E79|nr:uncharacterized protein F5B22DRAFT_107480 [Xylaria bambusicola]KAI0517492.1 hypothetical protein F5B22DRAFT_107480 [Xylaria bambusicola]